MNRPLRFRVWDKSKNNFLNKTPGTHCFSEYYLDLEGAGLVRFDGSYTDHEERYSRAAPVDYYFEGTKIVKENPYIITQFTGLVDKNGVEIYEGDICKLENLFNFEIIFNKNECSFGPINKSAESKTEVIGNIFENPELFKNEQN